ncbi:MAG: sigma-70 family RNA polymerase sigma factor [Treponema sp.]|nr:sigma-70 family RNA polymerase sigma factor [Treponema sp.]
MEMYENYLSEIQRYALLTAEQEAALSKRIEAGDKAAFDELVRCNLRLVVSVAKRFCCDKVSVMDLVQEGNLGLMTAAEKYHYSFKTRFSTYAYTWIMQYMLRYLYNCTSLIAIPHRKEEVLRKARKAQASLKQKLGREPDCREIAQYLHMDECELKGLMAYSYSISSLDAPCSEDGDVTVGELLPDSAYSPETLYLQDEARHEVTALLDTLPLAERTVIFSRYNFEHALHVKTLRELSIELDVSAETIRQMELRAVRRMRRLLMARRQERETQNELLG